MGGTYNFLTLRCNCLVIVLAIISQFTRVHSRYFHIFADYEPQALLSWENNTLPVEAPIVPDACKQGVLCESVKNYPTELATTIFDKLSSKNITKFTNDKLCVSNCDPEDPADITDLCETKKEKIMFPRAAKDQFDKWQFVLNMYPHQFQSFRVHECQNGSKVSCSNAVKIDKERFSWQCEQKLTNRKMVYLNLEKMIVAMGDFQVPSCCSCFLKPR